jgi:hypothetical protein
VLTSPVWLVWLVSVLVVLPPSLVPLTRLPGKLPEDGSAKPPLGARAAALGFPAAAGGAKKLVELRGV